MTDTLKIDHGKWARTSFRPSFTPLCQQSALQLSVTDGRIDVIGSGSETQAFVNDALASVAMSTLDGMWARFKCCGALDCARAFWDPSRNRIAKYCSGTCANRSRQRQFRIRNQRPSPFPTISSEI